MHRYLEKGEPRKRPAAGPWTAVVPPATSEALSAAIDQTLRYYAFFQHPLRAQEVWQRCGVACTAEAVLTCLQDGEAAGRLFSQDGYFSPLPDVARLLERRLQGGERAAADLVGARRVARFLYGFPFVSFVGISGSLSKGYADARSDFDFFIVTEKDRLWITRTLLHLFKKLTFLAGQQHKFCMNYFVDETALALPGRNIYTATELATLVPVCGPAAYRRLLDANRWYRDLLPNYRLQITSPLPEAHGSVKRLVSGLFNRLKPAALNAWLMALTDRKWRKKWAKRAYPAADYDQAFQTRINISKNHHLNYQKRILTALQLHEER